MMIYSRSTSFFTILFITLAFVTALFAFPQQSYAADCKVTSAKFINYAGIQATGWYKSDFGRLVKIEIIGQNCENKEIEVSITEKDSQIGIDVLNDDLEDSGMDNTPFTIPGDNKLNIYLWIGEDECDNAEDPDCNYFINIWDDTATVLNIANGSYMSDGKPNGNLKYDCDGTCDLTGKTWKLAYDADGGRCAITSAQFSPSGVQTGAYYSDGAQPLQNITIQTENCANKKIEVSITEEDDDSDPGPFDDDIANFDNEEFIVPEGGTLTIKAKVGDDECEKKPSDSDCVYHLELWNPINIKFNFESYGNSVLKFECDEECNDKNWVETYSNAVTTNGDPVWANGEQSTTVDVDPNDPCAQTTGGVTTLQENCYTLLAPLPSFTHVKGKIQLGEYINIIVTIVIAIAGVLAVVMLIVGGVQYMTTDALAGKSDARATITKAILGLILALASYVILKTINPNLVNVNPDIKNIEYTATVGADGAVIPIDGSSSPTDQNSEAFKEWARTNSKPIILTKANGEKVEVHACEESNMESVSAFNMTYKVHKLVAPSLKRVNAKWVAEGGDTFYKIPKSTGGGGYNCRLTVEKTGISVHAYGLSIDINPTQNPFGKTKVTDMPAKFIGFFTAEGWGWGGNWKRVKDAMHFSKEIKEMGNQKID